MPMPVAPSDQFQSSGDTILASAARTATGNSANILTNGPIRGAVIEVVVSAASGTTPTLDVDLEDTMDGGLTWNKVDDVNASNLTTTGTTIKRLSTLTTPCTNKLRIKYTIGGTTPSFTFTVKVHLIRGV